MQQQRITYMDQLKVLLTFLVVIHHAGQAYGPTGGIWVVNDPAKAAWLREFFFINASFMMGLYFFIAGYFLQTSMYGKTIARVLKDRLRRLGIPLLLFTFGVFLPFNYLIAGNSGNLFQFFSNSYFHTPPAATGHLWFIASLLVYSILYLLSSRYLSGLFRISNFSISLPRILLFVVLITVISAWVRTTYPVDTWKTWLIPVEVAHIPQYVSLFLLGTQFRKHKGLSLLKPVHGLVMLIAGSGLWLLRPFPVSGLAIAESFTESLLCVGISISLLTLFREKTRLANIIPVFIAPHTYGIYLLHLFIVIGLQQLLLPWSVAAETKLLVVSVSGILLSLLATAVLRKIKFVRSII